MSALGAQPVEMAIGEVYIALERGVVDCAISGTGIANAQRWHEVVTHMYALTTSYGILGYVVNLAWWNKLDPPVREFLERDLPGGGGSPVATWRATDPGRDRMQYRKCRRLQDLHGREDAAR